MKYTTIKVKQETRDRLFELTSELRMKHGKRMSIDEAISYLLHKNRIDITKIKSVQKRVSGLDLSGELRLGRSVDD